MSKKAIDILEKKYGQLPKIYRDCLSEGIADTDEYQTFSIKLFTAEQALTINVAPDDCEIDGMKPIALDGLIPIASLYDIDLWVLDNKRGGRVIHVPHDDNVAYLYAPSVEAWLYRLCLEEASDFPDEDEVVQEQLSLWGNFLARYAPSWGEKLIELANATRSENADGTLAKSELKEIVKNEFKEEEISGYAEFLRLEEF